eukprot:3586861-Pyramimonas_sp.AAC.1
MAPNGDGDTGRPSARTPWPAERPLRAGARPRSSRSCACSHARDHRLEPRQAARTPTRRPLIPTRLLAHVHHVLLGHRGLRLVDLLRELPDDGLVVRGPRLSDLREKVPLAQAAIAELHLALDVGPGGLRSVRDLDLLDGAGPPLGIPAAAATATTPAARLTSRLPPLDARRQELGGSHSDGCCRTLLAGLRGCALLLLLGRRQ